MGWHEYAVEYDGASRIDFAFDGVVYETVDGTSPTFFDVPYYVILNTAVGGPWPKPPDAKTVFPTYHYVDYVRVAQPNGPTPPPAPHCDGELMKRSTNMNQWYSDRVARQSDCDWMCG